MRVTVCQMPDERSAFKTAWRRLVEHVRDHQSQIVVLPEMIGSAWFPAMDTFEEETWAAALRQHDELLARFPDLGSAAVIGSRPCEVDGARLNRGFIWTAEEGVRYVHDKYYFPDEAGYHEARWFNRPHRDFSPSTVAGVPCGMLICTDVMFNEWARHYGRSGAVLIAVPRASSPHQRWTVALRMAAVASGCFVLSSNRVDSDRSGQQYGGPGLVVAPEGDVAASTSADEPFVTTDVDIGEAVAARSTYPRYVRE